MLLGGNACLLIARYYLITPRTCIQEYSPVASKEDHVEQEVNKED
jgi:hypothetical protein